MKRILTTLLLALPLLAGAQTKLSQQIIDDFSEKAAARYLQPNDSLFGFISEQMTRSGAGGLEIDKTMTELKKDPTALDATLKYLFQYSNGNRQQLIAQLRAMNIQSNYVFPVATYTVNKFKDQAKELAEEKPGITFTLPRRVSAPVAAAPATTTSGETTTATTSGETTTTAAGETVPAEGQTAAATAPAPTGEDGINWEIRDVFKVTTPEQLINMYGKQNIALRDAADFEGNDIGKAYYVFPDSDNELEVYFSGDTAKIVSFTRENAKWKSPFGIKVGDPIEKITKMNGRSFRFNAFEWENGGTIDSWQGGALDNKGVYILFKAVRTGDNKLYDAVTGDKKLSSDAGAVKRIGVVVDKVQFRTGGI